MKILNLRDWSRAIKERDLKCMHCNSEYDLHAHHIKPKASHPELMLDISNGITLCYRCHKAEHEKHRGVRIRSNRPQVRTLLKTIDKLKKDLIVADILIGKKQLLIQSLSAEIKRLTIFREI